MRARTKYGLLLHELANLLDAAAPAAAAGRPSPCQRPWLADAGDGDARHSHSLRILLTCCSAAAEVRPPSISMQYGGAKRVARLRHSHFL